ncbi:hypothetical protein D3C72_1031330 [compost metagenome]
MLRHKVDGGCEADSTGNMGGARLELEGQGIEGGAAEADLVDHLAPRLPGWHAFQQFGSTPQHTNPGRAIELVTGEGIEVAAYGLYIHLEMGHRLGAVDQGQGANRFGGGHHPGDRIDGTEGIGDMGHAHQSGARPQHGQVSLHIQIPALIQRNDPNYGAGAFGNQLPGDNIGVVLQGAEDDLVPYLEFAHAPALGHQIDRLGGAAGPDHLVAAGRIDKAGDRLAGCLEGAGGAAAQGMGGAVYVGVVGPIVVSDGVQHRLRLLGGGGVVQIDQRVAVHLLRQGRKLATQLGVLLLIHAPLISSGKVGHDPENDGQTQGEVAGSCVRFRLPAGSLLQCRPSS